ncbi:polycomb complex protein BMI-1-like [Uloborus diversus]|uniref:polycomb complex protein BMI-1-like n=1 Tax=Uloborus diversus TaxID=327109 RepID=UPI0024095DDC|nr:polycomb complex protein BMI-1-like [Uloborus diversus]
MQNSGKIKIADLNKLLTCKLCKGYYIDATTIVECLHSFCRTCILRYLQICECCPTCHEEITRPSAFIRPDPTLQDIVYKLVPGLFKDEMKRRRDFYSQQNPQGKSIQSSIPSSSEKRGDVWGCDRLIFTPEDIISVSIEYYNANPSLPLSLPRSIQKFEVCSLFFLYFLWIFMLLDSLDSSNESKNQTHRRYLRCPGAVTVCHLKKFLRSKYGLNPGEKCSWNSKEKGGSQ